MKCTMCGTENEAGAKFCTSCGAKLIEAEGPINEAVSQPAEPEVKEPVQEAVAEPVQGIEGVADEQLNRAEEAVNQAADSLSGAASDGLNNMGSTDYSSDYNAGYNDIYVEEGGGYIGFAIASLVCGILSILCCMFSCIDTPLSIAAIVLGVVTMVKAYDGKGFAIAGIITGAIGIPLQIIMLYAFSAGGFFNK
ncbi:MAG: DUF4190 domain-containing protein [Lachnospiraceae bacterium]|nr:DUF4190 domain-containing protein [Lachnospiraceae bacterium]